MVRYRQYSICFSDFFHSRFDANSEDFIWVKLLEVLDTHDLDKVHVHEHPEQQHHSDAHVEAVSPHASSYFFHFLRYQVLEGPRFRILRAGVDLLYAVDHRLDRVVGIWQGDAGHQGHRKVVEGRVIVLEHVLLCVAFEIIAERSSAF
jgi:hypothetical protein